MALPEKWRIAHLSSDAHDLYRQIISEFERVYTVENKPEGMALFNHTIDGMLKAVSITPKSVPYCAPLFALAPWEESEDTRGFGFVGFDAGDERLK